jgi:hypothetical protein
VKQHIPLVLACLSFALVGPASAAVSVPGAQGDWDAVSYATAMTAMQHAPATLVTWSSARLPAAAPDVATPPMVGSYVATVLNITGTPCFNCVNGSTSGTFGTGDPLGYVNTTLSALGVLFVYFDVSYTGSCTVSVALTQGTKTLASGSGSASFSPGGVYDSMLKVTRASTWHGTALMTGKLVCGSTTVTNTGHVHFQ